MSMMKKTGNGGMPTSTALLSRLLVYQPSQRPTIREGDWVETSFGKCSVDGRLGQRHADVVESILHCAEKSRVLSDEGVELLVDPARVRKTLSNSKYCFGQVEKLLGELQEATIIIETLQFDFMISGRLIDHVIASRITRPDPLTGGERKLWCVRLGVALVKLLQHDLCFRYDPAPIARLKHGISQAVARHIQTHRFEPSGGWYLDTVILAVTGYTSNQVIRDARRRLRADAGKLKCLGVMLDGDRLRVLGKQRAGNDKGAA